MAETLLDMDRYPRRAHFDTFRAMDYPYAGVCADVDITALYGFIRERRLPFFLTLVYVLTRAANGVPELRRRIRGEGIVEFSHCDSSYTLMLEDETYCHCRLDFAQPFERYILSAPAEQERERCSPGLVPIEEEESLFFVSCLPWLSFTALVQPVNLHGDSNPRITVGKYREQNGRVLLPVSLLAHHALADGLHLCRFFKNLEEKQLEYLRTPESV